MQQAVVAEVSGASTGRGLGLYESATLIGGAVGAVLAGALYETSSWTAACLFFAAVTLGGAVVVPRAVRRLGVPDVPQRHTPAVPAAVPGPLPGRTTTNRVAPGSGAEPGEAGPEEPVELPAPQGAAAKRRPEPAQQPMSGDREAPERMAAVPSTRTKSPGRRLVELGQHAVLFLIAQVLLLVLDLSWIADLAVADDLRAHLLSGSSPQLEGLRSLFYGAGRIWVIVFAVDLIWTAWVLLSSASRRRKLR
ncbi:hypothetical protein DQ238_06550 [Geodermatophilus sp. TF02-6]|uniref:hypothetical protein n=1 Tax=Geodermatophilus sp. TF02-6 TaxID=2250575 RepID=UPI000DE87F15|nr:hypothetical protein DQ238_06550 [Geodermatophilus sp. TF02-6]